ncbi:MAG: WbqC family protein [Rhodobiaceae bacterium]|nr:WbqC family protein [Rhodobiaceae bacterium]
MSERIVAIHQPNFFPWLGYFAKIAKADVFVFLDDAQFPKKGGTWVNRVKIFENGAGRWLTAPIDRAYSGTRAISEMRFAGGQNWREKTTRALASAYGRAAHFETVMPLLEPLILDGDDSIAEYNIRAVRALAQMLGLRGTEFVRSSQIGGTRAGTERLIDITRAVDGAIYLCGNGAGGYQEDALFAEAGLGLRYNGFVCDAYPQPGGGDFVAGLSVIDAMLNTGIDGVRKLLDIG